MSRAWSDEPVAGWWQASDGRWYPPALHPGRSGDEPAPHAQVPEEISPPRTAPTAPHRRRRGRRRTALLAGAVVAALGVGTAVGLVVAGDGDGGGEGADPSSTTSTVAAPAASAPSTTRPPATPAPSTTAPDGTAPSTTAAPAVGEPALLPDVVGLSEEVAAATLRSIGFVAVVEPAAPELLAGWCPTAGELTEPTVAEQEPEPATLVPVGDEVILRVAEPGSC